MIVKVVGVLLAMWGYLLFVIFLHLYIGDVGDKYEVCMWGASRLRLVSLKSRKARARLIWFRGYLG